MGLHDRLKSTNGSSATATAESLGAPAHGSTAQAPVDPYAELKTRIHHACIATLGAELFKRETTEDLSERVTRAAIRQIPSGEYREEMLFEDENEVTGGPVPLRVVVRIEGDHATVDLSASPPQVNASINAPLVSTKSVTRAPFKTIVPGDTRRCAIFGHEVVPVLGSIA